MVWTKIVVRSRARRLRRALDWRSHALSEGSVELVRLCWVRRAHNSLKAPEDCPVKIARRKRANSSSAPEYPRSTTTAQTVSMSPQNAHKLEVLVGSEAFQPILRSIIPPAVKPRLISSKSILSASDIEGMTASMGLEFWILFVGVW